MASSFLPDRSLGPRQPQHCIVQMAPFSVLDRLRVPRRTYYLHVHVHQPARAHVHTRAYHTMSMFNTRDVRAVRVGNNLGNLVLIQPVKKAVMVKSGARDHLHAVAAGGRLVQREPAKRAVMVVSGARDHPRAVATGGRLVQPLPHRRYLNLEHLRPRSLLRLLSYVFVHAARPDQPVPHPT